YQEGNHWSWAECAGIDRGRINPGIKGRYGGEGLYTLPLKEGDQIIEEKTDSEIYLDSRKYENFYGEGYLFDFSGYDHFNFMVKFPGELNPPVDIRLEMYGLNEELYFSKNVLSYTTNNPFFTDNFMHVQMPLPQNLKGVAFIKLNSAPVIDMTVRNVYLSKESQDQLCSGQDAIEESSWLTDIDQADPRKEIDGEQLCTELFGLEAWLGDDEEVDLPEASCCGNTKSEYYAGSSDPLGENETYYGCWNSQPIADGETTMNVEYLVQYYNTDIVLDYQPIDFTYSQEVVAGNFKIFEAESYSCPDFVCGAEMAGAGCSQVFNDGCTGVTKTEPGETCTVSYEFCSVYESGCVSRDEQFNCDQTSVDVAETYTDFDELLDEYDSYADIPDGLVVRITEPITEDYQWQKSSPAELQESNSAEQLIFLESPKVLRSFEVRKKDFFITETDEYYGQFTITPELPTDANYRVYFYDPLIPYDYGPSFPASQLQSAVSTLYVLAEMTENYQPIKTFNHENPTNTYTHSCNQDECLFPLPGEPPYTITNPHPDLYNLFFVTDEGELPIGQEATTDLSANIKAKRVAQQIIYNYPEDDDPQFYGCQAPTYLEEATEYLFNQPYCSYKSGKFCSFSTQHEEESGEIFSTINSWSDEAITQVGYESVELTTESMEDFYNRIELNLKPYTENQDRNFTSIALPTRNIISNAEFKPKGSK
ncbi:MAG: hypothetical protein KJ771_08160, partial [Nanoarchaeota archaeon]|nr:hypothetical protein [Nanoarchaeota archaeon]